MKKKPFPRKYCKWIIEAKLRDGSHEHLFRPGSPYHDWNRISYFALSDGRTHYDVPTGKPSRPMPTYALELLIEKAKKETWSPAYDFRFTNIKTKETIPFALFPEIKFEED